ncbi:MAG: PDZ domain-containing protein [Betaproteobacteria bacterium]|nr:MAG: PDZ domain-containing protein [Betaproteobacteria bacterium]TDI83304.1 MAG: PDZ domain-containing protein [Betaproteobacteria bacterium]
MCSMTISRCVLHIGILSIVLLVLGTELNVAHAEGNSGNKEKSECVPVASWVVPGGKKVSDTEVISRAVNQSVVLLGEEHANPEHHRWQLQMLVSLYTLHPDMVIGFEMFPRRVQNVLDQWVAGEFSVAEFLVAVDWKHVWSTDASAYLPLFHFARMNRIPMVALNIDVHLRQEISLKGFDSISDDKLKGVTRPAVPSVAYLDYLMPIYKKHDRDNKDKGEISRDDLDFQRFVGGQQLWDRSMAQALHSALSRPGRPLVVGIMGAGHIKYGYGVPHQLKDLGIEDVAMFLPWDGSKACEHFVPGIADAVFGVASYIAPHVPHRQRLGIRFEMVQNGALVLQIEKGSIAEASGIKNGDTITDIAGLEVKQINDVVEAVQRQAPGTWLPLRVKRGGETIEIIAKFPAVM